VPWVFELLTGAKLKKSAAAKHEDEISNNPKITGRCSSNTSFSSPAPRSVIDPEAHESVGASVVSHGDRAPVLEPVQHGLDAMSLSIDSGVIGKLKLAVLARRDAWPGHEPEHGI
jgi:hypothetical protein